MSKQQQLNKLKERAASFYSSALRANGKTYNKEMDQYRKMKVEIAKLENEIKVDASIRRADLAKIHIARKDLEMDDDVYRAVIMRVTNGEKSSSAKLNVRERGALLNEFKRLGWNPERRKYSPRSYHKDKHEKTLIDKIRALWIQMHNEGITESGDEKALANYCNRMVQKQSPDWMTPKEQVKVLESLKQWRKRLWKQWYDEDIELLKRIKEAEGELPICRISELVQSGQIRHHKEFSAWGVEPPK